MNENNERWTVCCGHCGYFLAMTDKKEVSVQYKYKELYVYFFGGAAIIICKGCSKQNYMIDDAWERNNPEQALKIKTGLNSVQAMFRKWMNRKLYQELKK